MAELQKKILSADETLLEYFLTAKGVFCFVVTRERFQTARLAVSEEILRENVEALLDNLESGPARGEGYDRAAAGELYDILLKPVEKSLEGRALIVVPDGILARLPFEALVVAKDGGRTYLLEENPVKYVQSASVLATLRTSSRPPVEQWTLRGCQDDPDALTCNGKDVYDIRSASEAEALDGTRYKDW